MSESVLSVSDKWFELYDRMIGDVEIPAVLRDVAEVVCQDRNAERASIYLIDEETKELVSVAVIGNVARTIRVPLLKSSLAGFCAVSGKTFIVPDAYGDLSRIDKNIRFDEEWDKINNFRTREVMCAPAHFKGRVLGVVQVINSKNGGFHDSDLQALNSISRLIGYALYHARLYDDLASLKQLEREKANFIMITVHELKSPMAAARMMIDAIKVMQPDNEQINPYLDKISNRMDQLLEMTGDLLYLAKVKTGDPLGDISIIDLGELTQSTCGLYRDQAAGKKINMEIDLPEKPVLIRFDSQGCRMVVSNLISNAVKYTPEGFIKVSLTTDDKWAVLAVADSGFGIPEDDIPKLFHEFFRASNARHSKIAGTGVGLAGVKTIVERFGGCMELQSRENEGTTFTVRIPLSNE